MEKWPITLDEDQNVLMRIAPLVNSQKHVPCFLVTFWPVDGNRETSQAAFMKSMPTLQNINVKFLAELGGRGNGGKNEIDTSDIAPNVGVMHPDNQIVDGVIRTRSMEYKVGWQNLCGCEPSQDKTQLTPTEATLLHVLNCVMSDAELGEVVDAIKRDAALQVRLIQYLNRAFLGHRFKSFENAVVFLGYRELERWLSMFLVMEIMPKHMSATMVYPIFFGKNLELLSKVKGFAPDKKVFIVGVFRVLSMILGQPFGKFLDALGENEALRETLVDGESAALWEFVQSYNQCPSQELLAVTKASNMQPYDLNQAVTKSFSFACGTGL